MIRGNNKGAIFADDYDRQDFLRRMGIVAEETSMGVYAFALMNNHVHMLLKSGPTGLPNFMRRLLTGYALYYNKRHQRVGHLFQNRYKSIICEEDVYFRKLVAYIHLNPLHGGLVSSLEELGSYPWCSHADLLGWIQHKWYDRDYVLNFFGKSKGPALRAYVALIGEEVPHDREAELDGGGLLRSQGSWSRVYARNGHCERQMNDERILGSGDFVQEMLGQAEKRIIRQLPLDERMELVREDINAACRDAGITLSNLRSGGRNGDVSRVRRQLAEKLVNERELTFAETARQLGITISAVSQIMQKLAQK
jgi:REP element-mobilizing transposase RayT